MAMLSVQPAAPSASTRPSAQAGVLASGPRLKRSMTSTRVGVESATTAIQVRPSSTQRPKMDLGRAARSVMAVQASTDARDDGEQARQQPQDKRDDPWSAVIRKVVFKAGGGVRPVSRANNALSGGETSAAATGSSKPASLALLLRSRKVKNLVRQAIVAREWSSTTTTSQAAMATREEPSMVMEQWVRTAALRSQQQKREQRRRRRRASNNTSDHSEDNVEELDEEEDGDGLDDRDAESDDDGSASLSSSSSSNDSFEAQRGLSDALHASRYAYSRHLLLEESCRRALAQSGDRRSDMDLQALRSWFQTTKLKMSTDFDRLPPSQLDALCRRMAGVSLAPSEVVFRQGDEGDALYVVFSGSVEVRVSQRVLGEQVEVTVCELARGDYFGERSLLSNDARAATVVATSSTELVKISRADYDLMLRNDQLEFLSRMQMTNGGSALAGLPKSLQQSQREYLRILGKTKHARSKADIALLSEYLQTLKFFRPLPANFVRELCGVVDLVCFSAADVVFREGEVGDLFFIIFSGSVDVLVHAADGHKQQQQTKLVNLTEGAHFGELALMKGRGVRSATVVAREESKLLVICEKDYNATLRRLQKRDLARRVAALDKLALFQTPEWTRDKLRELSYVLVDHKLATGAVLFTQGDKAQHVYFVVRGELVAERALIDPLSKRGSDNSATTTAVVERISRFRMIGDEAAAGATFNELTFREVTVTASTPVELLVLSKYDVFHRLPPAMRDALRCGNAAASRPSDGLSDGFGPRVEPVVYVDRFVKSAKWDALRRRVVHEHVNHERVARRLAATARSSTAKRSPTADLAKRTQSRAREADRPGADRLVRPLVDANEFLLVPSEREAVATSFARSDCVAGYASLARYVTGFNADAPPSEARARQLGEVLAAERRRDAHIVNEGNPLAYFDADDVRRQHLLQLQQQFQQEEGESWSRQSSSRRLMDAVGAKSPGFTASGSTVSASMSQCLQENYICSLPADPGDQANRSDPGGDGDFAVVRFRFTRDAGNGDSPGPSTASAFQIIQSVRPPVEACEAALSSINAMTKAQVPSDNQHSMIDTEAAGDVVSSFFLVPKRRFALPPGVPKALEEQLQQQIVERFGRWPAAPSDNLGDDASGSPPREPASPSCPGTSVASNGSSWSRVSALFASFDAVALQAAPLPDTNQPSSEEASSQAGRPGRKSFAAVSVVLSRREIVNGSSDEPFLCVHGVFSSEAEAVEYAMSLGPPPLRSALVCVLPARQWVSFEDAYDWCVQVEPDRRETRAPSSTLVVSPNRSKPPTRPTVSSPAAVRASDSPSSPSGWRLEQVEAARLHQFICMRMGMPKNAAAGGDESGFTAKPSVSLEDKLSALQEYLDASSTSVSSSRSAMLAAVGATASAAGSPLTTGAVGAGGGSRLLGKVRQMQRFGSILRSRIRSHHSLSTSPNDAPSAPSSASISSVNGRRATDAII